MNTKSIFCTLVLAHAIHTLGTPAPKFGFRTVRIDDGVQSHCINSIRERVTIQARTALLEKATPGLFTRESQVLLLLKTRVRGTDAQGRQKSEEFPLLFPMSVEDYAAGKISLPIGRSLVSRYPLTDDGNQYDGIEIDLSILTTKSRRPLGGGLKALAKISSEMPLPINPFSESFKYYINFANSVVDEALKDSKDVELSAPVAILPLSFSSGDICADSQDRTGTYVVVRYETGEEKAGIADLDRPYCWRSTFRPVESILFSPEPADGNCSGLLPAAFMPLNNQHITFFVNAELIEPKTSPVSYTRYLYLPSVNGTAMPLYAGKINPADLKYMIAASYNVTDTTYLDSLSSKAFAYLTGSPSWTISSKSRLPPDYKHVTVTGTDLDYFAGYLQESLTRCLVHGVTPEKCLYNGAGP